jgi:hypothetical protein
MFAAMEDLALAALDDGMTRDALAQGLAGLPAPGPAGPSAQVWHDGGAVALCLPQCGTLAGLLAAPDCQGPGIWTSRLHARDLVLAGPGLPDARQALRLFDPEGAFGIGGGAE